MLEMQLQEMDEDPTRMKHAAGTFFQQNRLILQNSS